MRAQGKILLVALLVNLLVACATHGNAGAVEISQHTWQAEDIDRGGIIDNSMVTLEFTEDGQVAGSTGCNRYFGKALLGDGDFSASAVGSTRRACAAALMDQEHRFLDALQSAERFKVEDDIWLILLDAQGIERVRFIRLEKTPGDTGVLQSGPSDAATGGLTRFTCSDGADFDVRFLGPETVQILISDRDYILQRNPTASGARYIGDGIDFWNKGADASLEIGGQRYHCARKE